MPSADDDTPREPIDFAIPADGMNYAGGVMRVIFLVRLHKFESHHILNKDGIFWSAC